MVPTERTEAEWVCSVWHVMSLTFNLGIIRSHVSIDDEGKVIEAAYKVSPLTTADFAVIIGGGKKAPEPSAEPTTDQQSEQSEQPEKEDQ
jgi:hypothetical protein